jgi:hypothetical protein
MALEEAGVPTVAIHTHVFSRLVRSTARASGMPTTRQAFVPQPVVDRTPAQLRAYIEGSDPTTGRPFMQEIIEGLTRPLDAEDRQSVTFERETPRFVEGGDEDELQALFIENRWTDNLPIVLPTAERVQRMLAGTSRAPDEIVGRMRPTFFREFWEFTVEKVAVNAVMAGARPEYFPVILAHAASGHTARSSSTNSFSVTTVVNGPIAREIGMGDGIGALGPYNHANATIGRAYNILSQNLQGGSVPGDTYMGTLGNGYNYSSTFAEAEERSPWQPLHVGQGYRADQSVVSFFFGGWYTQAGYGPRETWKEKFQHALAASEHYLPPLLVMDPIVARGFVELGFDTRESLADWLATNTHVTAREYWDNQWVQTLLRPLAAAGVEPHASRLNAPPDELINMYVPDDINIVVVGGETQGAWKMIGGRLLGSVLVDEWR